MTFTDQTYNLRIELDTKNFEFSPEELAKIEEVLDPLRDPVRGFPVTDLYLTVIHHPISDDYHVRASLVLPKRTLFTGDRDVNALSAWSRCVRKLVNKVNAYKENLAARPERSKSRQGTAHDVVPTSAPDVGRLRESVAAGDYAAFREAAFVYEEAVRKRAGRWIERYPQFEAQLGITFTVSDLVEEVFLNAFEWFDQRPEDLRLGQWIENLIDPSLRALLNDPDAERENIDAVQSVMEPARNQPRDTQ